MNDELLNNALFEQVNQLMQQNMDVIIRSFKASCPDLDEESLDSGIAAIRISTQLSLYTMIKLFETIGLLKLPDDGQAILNPLD